MIINQNILNDIEGQTISVDMQEQCTITGSVICADAETIKMKVVGKVGNISSCINKDKIVYVDTEKVAIITIMPKETA